MAAHAHGSATAADFAAALARASRQDVDGVFRSFIEQPGVPVVEAEVTCQGGAARARVRQHPERPPGAPEVARTWNIPICLRHGAGGKTRSECFVLAQAEAEHRLDGPCPEWVAWNAGHSGYYLTAGQALQRLFAARDRVGRAELLGGLADLATLVEHGSFPIGDALRLTEPILAAGDPEARLFIVELDDHARRFVADDQLEQLQRRIRDRYAAVMASIELGPQPGEDRMARMTRQEIGALVAEATEDRRFAPEAERLARRFLTDGTGLDRGDRTVILGEAAAWGDAAFFDAVKDAVRRAAPREQRILVGLLVQTRDAAQLRSSFEWALADGKIAPSNLLELISLSRTPARSTQWELIEKHLDGILARVPEDARSGSMRFGFDICDDGERTRWEKLFGERAARLKDGAEDHREVRGSMDQCIAVRAIQEPSLRAWLAGS